MFANDINEKSTPLEKAMAYWENGWSVIPVSRDTKQPLIGSWKAYQKQQPTEQQIENWFRQRRNVNPALICTDFCVVDADTQEAVDWCEKHIHTPVKVATRKGKHYYFRNTHNFRHYVSDKSKTTLEKRIDIVATYALAPYAVHETGFVYTPDVDPFFDFDDLSDLPILEKDIVEKIRGSSEDAVKAKPFDLKSNAEIFAPVVEGSRNMRLTQVAGSLIAKGHSPEEVLWILKQVNDTYVPPLDDEEIRTIIDSLFTIDNRKLTENLDPVWKKPQENFTQPDGILEPPGILSKVWEYAEQVARTPQPYLSVQIALALGSVLCSRLYKTDIDNFSSLFFLNVAKSGQGKENSKKVIEKILHEAGLEDMLAGSGYTSSGAVFSTLARKPSHIVIIDEFGKRMEQIVDNDEHVAQSAMRILMESWGRCDGVLRPDQYSEFNRSKEWGDEDRNIYYPGITLMGMTVPKNFYDAISNNQVQDGFLNRFIVAESTQARVPSKLKPSVDPHHTILSWAQDLRGYHQYPDWKSMNHNAQTRPPELTTLQFDAAALEHLEDFERTLVKKQSDIENTGLEVLYSRTREKAMRLALICTLAQDVERKIIDLPTVEWCCNYVNYYDTVLVEMCRERVASSRGEKSMMEVLSFIREQGEKGVSKRDLDRHSVFRSFPKRQLNEILERLQNSGDIQERKQRGRGRPKLSFIATERSYFDED